jgi:hypothetical protein
MLFLPGTFICAVFSMVFFNFSNGGSSFDVSPWVWLYPAVTIPLTGLVFGWYQYWSRRREMKLPTQNEHTNGHAIWTLCFFSSEGGLFIYFPSGHHKLNLILRVWVGIRITKLWTYETITTAIGDLTMDREGIAFWIVEEKIWWLVWWSGLLVHSTFGACLPPIKHPDHVT